MILNAILGQNFMVASCCSECCYLSGISLAHGGMTAGRAPGSSASPWPTTLPAQNSLQLLPSLSFSSRSWGMQYSRGAFQFPEGETIATKKSQTTKPKPNQTNPNKQTKNPQENLNQPKNPLFFSDWKSYTQFLRQPEKLHPWTQRWESRINFSFILPPLSVPIIKNPGCHHPWFCISFPLHRASRWNPGTTDPGVSGMVQNTLSAPQGRQQRLCQELLWLD